MEIEQPNSPNPTTGTVSNSRSDAATVPPIPNTDQNFTILPPKASPQIHTNKATSPTHIVPPLPIQNQTTEISILTTPENQTTLNPLLPNAGKIIPPGQKKTLVDKLRAQADMSLRRLAPVTIAPTGRPRVVIPDAVFQKGAEIHKDFIICYFNGKSPPYNQIQSVFNYMWGKGKRLEIHNNPLNHSVIVRIQSEYLRKKILDKNIWYVGDSMFHTAQWNSDHSTSTPPLKAIKIWAHLTGVPIDLRHDEGLSLVAGLVGEPKETDEFTKNLVSLTVSHVKVEVDLTVPLPPVVEFERQSGEVVEVQVHYPWVPPTCSHCHELGHIIRNCLTYTPPAPETGKQNSSNHFETQNPTKNPPKTPQKTPLNPSNNSLPSPSGFTPSKASKKKNHKVYRPISQPPFSNLPSQPADPPIFSSRPNPFATPDPPPKPSLKRSRSSPTLSPPPSSTANPFSVLQDPSIPDHSSIPFCNLPPKPPDPVPQTNLASFDLRGPPQPEDPQPPSQ
ncbi:Uncharacterized protein Rs2_07220 [Raphanus sativus]|nr:Uncharacterized protein Rs2_07220 [Raphanus sativus]